MIAIIPPHESRAGSLVSCTIPSAHYPPARQKIDSLLNSDDETTRIAPIDSLPLDTLTRGIDSPVRDVR